MLIRIVNRNIILNQQASAYDYKKIRKGESYGRTKAKQMSLNLTNNWRNTTAEQVGSGIATVLVMPHLVFTVLAVIFNALGLFMRKRGFALTGAILYTVALVLFPVYFMFVIVEMILSYIGFAKMKK